MDDYRIDSSDAAEDLRMGTDYAARVKLAKQVPAAPEVTKTRGPALLPVRRSKARRN